MGAKVQFDGSTKLIRITAAPTNGVVSIDVKKDLYSDGKEDWISDPSLSRLQFPIRSLGGDTIGGGLSVGSYFFLDNTSGWRIRPYEGNHQLNVFGNLYGEDPDLPIYTATTGSYVIPILQERSSLSQVSTVETGGGTTSGSGSSANDIWAHPKALTVGRFIALK
jgi:hypothetical protein